MEQGEAGESSSAASGGSVPPGEAATAPAAGDTPAAAPAEAKVEAAEPKMEVDPAAAAATPAIKEEKMEVDEEAEKEGDKEKEKEDTKPRILLSGMESSQRKQMAEIVERLEGSLTEEPGQATHLVMPRLSRTNNFLLCLPTIKFVLKVTILL